MSPTQRLAKARDIIESLNRDIIRAIALDAFYSRCADKKDVIEAVDDTFVAHGFRLIRESLHIELIIVLMRVHDKGSKEDDATLPSVIRLLSDPDVQTALWNETREGVLGIPHTYLGEREPEIEIAINQMREKTAEGHAKNAVRAVHSVIRACKRFQQDGVIAALRNLRNKHLAHSTLYTGKHGAKYGYPHDLLKETIPVVQKLGSYVNYVDFNFGDYRRVWRSYAGYYWRHVAKGPFETRRERSRKNRRARPHITV